MPATYNAILSAPFGKIGVRTDGARIRAIVYLPGHVEGLAPADALTQRLAAQLAAYYDDPDAAFDVPLAAAGSAFQQRVWQAICAVPRGATTTYGTIADTIGAMPRAVGQACGQNPFPILVPCHRVVSARGIGGFSHHAEDGFYLDVKRWLLRHEGAMLI
ncbi:methylated-DNA--[protein]-cysteine S-methyltransferase [Cupriavidus taiwanensis]|uniref:methylated-DNA--[protein]-cysteine S-methyltransferase n=1 Tax=Cupriavidus taiwanensis TaxID=164546 RepID=A0A7Z7J5X0_9BURK|nr:methylated-DNA--[protein]-cysteine S-methyltransferase [Cupriavidus taiwanensis]SOY87055.1 putative METHYLATED-DNA--PROTEIN-CYSTEINE METHYLTRANSFERASE [Cupriavidus taiwanensis]SOZ01486.1 putative METHYLATED-DNA--PROTEIN-CYSTEINE METHYLTRANSFERASE [Cupriavidus taiwanensis]SOZ04411.1 putative METHYLATED-DNA--PROTEIN-CYSTEINE METHYLTRANSFERASE [Cupriavidus taiwanensis]SPC09019.1 putative METHYLATED-DNA--PROTEIN-CYSTEINE METHYLTRANSFERASE [Cupriavidus taiwanensis]SPD38813.1 putative METHYLATED-